VNEKLKLNYGYLFEEELLKEINEVGVVKDVSKGYKLMEIGDYVTSMPLLISGAIKILHQDTNGDDLILYFLERGDTCAMTMECCMGQAKSEIRAIAETDAQLIMIPVEKISEWLGKYKSWQSFILKSYHSRVQELLEVIENIAFLQLDERLLKFLRDKAMVNNNDIIQVTHQKIAHDLHTSRVVVSRLLKKLENQGKIKLNRNSIQILHL
jgi:CRP/FNR family transcriptional regulator